MITIKVKGIEELVSNLDTLAKKELPFATAKGLSDIGRAVQAEIINTLPQKFTIRRNWYAPNTPYGIKLTMATKTNLVATVFTKAPWLPLQEYGGIKQINNKRLAIPFLYHSGMKPGVVFGAKHTKRDLIQAKDKPRNLGAGAFELKTKNGNTLLAQRTGKGKRSVLRILYSLEQQATIKPRLSFEETATKVVNQVYAEKMIAALEYAIKTSRLK